MKTNEMREFTGQDFHMWFYDKTERLNNALFNISEQSPKETLDEAYRTITKIDEEAYPVYAKLQSFEDTHEIEMARVYSFAMQKLHQDCMEQLQWMQDIDETA